MNAIRLRSLILEWRLVEGSEKTTAYVRLWMAPEPFTCSDLHTIVRKLIHPKDYKSKHFFIAAFSNHLFRQHMNYYRNSLIILYNNWIEIVLISKLNYSQIDESLGYAYGPCGPCSPLSPSSPLSPGSPIGWHERNVYHFFASKQSTYCRFERKAFHK